MNLNYSFVNMHNLSEEDLKQALIQSYNTFSYSDKDI